MPINEALGYASHIQKYSESLDTFIVGPLLKKLISNSDLKESIKFKEVTIWKDKNEYKAYEYTECCQTYDDICDKYLKLFISGFLTKDISIYQNDKRIESVYRTCGVDPWLFIYNTPCSSDLSCIDNYLRELPQICPDFGIKYISISSHNHSIDIENDNFPEMPPQPDLMTSWVFLKGLDEYISIKHFIHAINDYQKPKVKKFFIIEEAYKIFGEYNYLFKIQTANLGGVDNFLLFCQKEKISTSTKCVLRTYKDKKDASSANYNMDDIRTKAKESKKEIQYTIARIMANTPNFGLQTFDNQNNIIKKALDKYYENLKPNEISKYLIDVKSLLSKKDDYLEVKDLQHPNTYIEKFSVKLQRHGWKKILLFFKAKQSQKEKLEDWIKENLLMAHKDRFSRKLFHMTGQYDFLVPLDISDLSVLEGKNGLNYKILQCVYVETFSNTLCSVAEDEGEASLPLLSPIEVIILNSLLLNSTNGSELELKLRTILGKLKSMDEINVPEIGVSPCEDDIRLNILEKGFKERIDEYLQNETSFKSIGIESSIEFRDGKLIQVLLKFYFNDVNKRDEFKKEMRRRIDEFDIIGIIYEPLREPLYIACIVTVKDLSEIEVLIDDLKDKYNKVEFHMLFHQRFHSRQISQKIRCKPCFYEDEKQNCETCIRYVMPRKKERRLKVDFGKTNTKKTYKITAIGTNLNLLQLLFINSYNDKDNKIFIREMVSSVESLSDKISIDSLANHDLAKYIRDSINLYLDSDEKSISQLYKDYEIAMKKLIQTYTVVDDILVFPEYSIPTVLYEEIRKSFSSIPSNLSEKIIVPGSHISDKFNICPVTIIDSGKSKIYKHYRNGNKSDIEDYFRLVSNYGTAKLDLMNTPWGNIAIRQGRDFEEIAALGLLQGMNILIIPDFCFKSDIVSRINICAKDYRIIAVYCNSLDTDDQNSSLIINGRGEERSEESTLRIGQFNFKITRLEIGVD